VDFHIFVDCGPGNIGASHTIEHGSTRLEHMRKLQIVTLFIIFLVALSLTSVQAQRRQERTGSAKAAYGKAVEQFPSKRKAKKKSKKSRKKKDRKSSNKNAAPLYRKRDPWVN
jgi:hypothetical protein